MITELLPQRRQLGDDGQLEEYYQSGRGPHLRINFISSLDGTVDVDGRSGPLGGPADRAAFMAMRALCDVVVVGAGTARAEGYGPVRLRPDVQARRRSRGQASLPPLAVVTARGDLQPSARMFDPDGRVLLLSTEAVAAGRPDLAAVAEVIPCGATTVDVATAIAGLRARGMARILCEGGPELTRALFDAGLVDELCLTISPLLAGAGRRLSGGAEIRTDGRFRLTGLLEADSMLLARYDTRRSR